ncbi:flagellar motor switch protein FliM [Thermaerobacter marianensis DSM 12885]|uniref:Flagellar motor switch protein FliM n=1 Tax=Thermaerobacter marianensis (strain ATCC 700841 / DSM 12885 / JCM 10246 / 7p75a) TaxID=644966 RepID=E6SJN8_THEM7|nr:flagellar motor switch protein FliM [Thermaerobacter marianensis]ADU51101.1 flagellar motor switch protein FliM [Thermaerobacter marianensis DSM 12885]
MNQGTARKGGRRSPVIRLYDFRRPDKFSKEQLRTLAMIHENVARLATGFLSGQLRTVVEVDVLEVEETTYGEFITGLANPTVVAVFNLPPLESSAVMDLEPSIAFPMVDRLFGGPGTGAAAGRGLTEIETVVMRVILQGLLGAVAEGWGQLVQVQGELVTVAANPLFVQVQPPNEIAVRVVMAVRFGQQEGAWRLCLPYPLLEPVLPRLAVHQYYARETKSHARSRERWEEGLRHVPLPVTVVLGRTRLTVRELLALEPGQVLRLDTRAGGLVDVLVAGRPKFRGLPGRAGPRLAVQVVERVAEEEQGHGHRRMGDVVTRGD